MSGRRFRTDPQLASHPTVSRPGQTTANPADDSIFVIFTDIVEEYLLLWILLSVGVGLVAPQVAVVTRASTLVLAVLIGSVSLPLSVDQFRRLDRRALGTVLLDHVAMPVLAAGIAHGLGPSPSASSRW